MRILSQFDAKRYKDELEGLREEMTDILLEMEQRHASTSREAFSRWWDEEGAMRRYFDLKGKAERIEQILAYSVVEEEDHPKMRAGDPWSGFFTGARAGTSGAGEDAAKESAEEAEDPEDDA